MLPDRKIIALFLLMVAALFQTAVAHSFEHDDGDSDHCTLCLVIHQSQPVVQSPQQAILFDSHAHAVFVEKIILMYSAFAKAEQQYSTLSIRPPPHSTELS
jgi:hypothetical protein